MDTFMKVPRCLLDFLDNSTTLPGYMSFRTFPGHLPSGFLDAFSDISRILSGRFPYTFLAIFLVIFGKLQGTFLDIFLDASQTFRGKQ